MCFFLLTPTSKTKNLEKTNRPNNSIFSPYVELSRYCMKSCRKPPETQHNKKQNNIPKFMGLVVAFLVVVCWFSCVCFGFLEFSLYFMKSTENLEKTKQNISQQIQQSRGLAFLVSWRFFVFFCLSCFWSVLVVCQNPPPPFSVPFCMKESNNWVRRFYSWYPLLGLSNREAKRDNRDPCCGSPSLRSTHPTLCSKAPLGPVKSLE